VAYSFWKKNVCFFRLDSIQIVKPLEIIENYESYQEYLKNEQSNIWGVAVGQNSIEHIEMVLTIEPRDIHIAHRLEREKRCGSVERLDETLWKFTADIYDAWELMPWLRTFIGRISVLTCSNKTVEAQFWADLSSMASLYGGDGDAV
jgi:hypothetical protein